MIGLLGFPVAPPALPASCDLPIWTATAPAIIRPAEHALLKPGAFRPCTRVEGRAILADLVRSGRLTREQAKAAIVFIPWVSASGPVLTYIGNQTDPSSQSTYTFSFSFGSGAADRHLVAVVGGRFLSPGFSGVTIGGAAASQIAYTTSGSGNDKWAIYIAAVPTGASGDVVVALTGSSARCHCGLYRLTGASSFTAADTATGTSSISGVTMPAGGVGLFAFFEETAGATCTLSGGGVLQDYLEGTEDSFSSGRIYPGDGSTPTVTATWSPNTNPAAVGASWI